MKVKMCKQSGAPISDKDVDLILQERRAKYDEVYDKYNMHTEMESVQAEIIKVEEELNAKYDSVVEVELPKNSKQWRALQKQYGYSVVVTMDSNHKETRLILLDQGL